MTVTETPFSSPPLSGVSAFGDEKLAVERLTRHTFYREFSLFEDDDLGGLFQFDRLFAAIGAILDWDAAQREALSFPVREQHIDCRGASRFSDCGGDDRPGGLCGL
jgi:hypothetical protein